MTKSAQDLSFATQNACDQLTRYGGHVADENVLEALEALTDVNDDLWNGMHKDVLKRSVGKTIAALHKIAGV